MNENCEKQDKYSWYKIHADAISVIGAICLSMIWMNGKFNEIEKDIAVMKTVLVMKQILPAELAINQEKK